MKFSPPRTDGAALVSPPFGRRISLDDSDGNFPREGASDIMAKHRDDQDQPRRKKDPSDVHPIDELEVVEDAEELVSSDELEVVEPPRGQDQPPPLPPKKTLLSGRAPQPTKLAPRGAQPTQLGPRGGKPTMLSPEGGAEELVEGEAAGSPPVPAAGMGDVPNLSLDEPARPDKGEDELVDVEAEELVEAEAAEEVLGVAEEPVDITSDVLAADEAEEVVGGSSIVDLVEVEDDSGVAKASDTPPPATPVEVASDVTLRDEGVEVLDEEELEILEAASAATPSPSGIEAAEKSAEDALLEAADELEEAAAQEEAVDLGRMVEAEDQTGVRMDIFEATEAGSSPNLLEDFDEEAGDKPDAGAETVQLEPGELEAGEEEADVLDLIETEAPAGSSAVVLEGDEAGDLDRTVAFEGIETEAQSDARPEDDLVTAEELGEDEDSSAVDLGAPRSKPLSGVDPLAEALESGVNLEEDDRPRKGKKKPAQAAEEELDEEAVVFDDEETPAKGRGRKTAAAKMEDVVFDGEEPTEMDADAAEEDVLDEEVLEEEAAAVVDEEDAADLLLSDDDEAEPVDGDEKEAAAVLSEDEEEEAGDYLLDEDEEDKGPRGKGKKGKASAKGLEAAFADAAVDEDEEDEELVPARGRAGTVLKRPPKPKYGRRWLGGILVGILLLGGGVAGLAFLKPDILAQGVEFLPDVKNEIAKNLPKPPPPAVPPLVQAMGLMSEQKYDDAITLLADADKSPENLTTRAQARWLRYLQEKGKDGKVARDDAEVKLVLGDAAAAKNEVLLNQIERTLAERELRDAVTGLKETEKTVLAIHEMLAKAGAADPKADLKDLPAAVAGTLAGKKAAEDKVGAVAKVMVDGKFLDDPAKFDPAAFGKVFTGLADDSTQFASVNMLLEKAKIKEAGPKGVQKLLELRQEAVDLLAAVDMLLEKEKTKEPGSKGVAELIQRRDLLAKERAGLDATVKAVFQELVEAKVLPPDADPRAKVVEGTKLVRSRAESPLAIPLSNLAGALGGLGLGTGKMVERVYDAAALASELNYFRLREPLIVGPEKKLDSHIALLLDRDRKAGDELTLAVKEAAWLISPEAKTAPLAAAKAHLVLGLAARNQERFDDARKELNAALAGVGEGKGVAWVEAARETLAEISDPRAYYLPLARTLLEQGRAPDAAAQLAIALKAMPDRPELLAWKALARLHQARAAAKTPAADVLAAVQRDVDAARALAKDDQAQALAAFAHGNLDEARNRLADAEKHYREAEKLAGDQPEGIRYTIALARLLQKERIPGDELVLPPVPMKKEEPKAEPKAEPKKDEKKDAEKVGSLETYFPLAAALAIGQPVPEEVDEDPVEKARLEESIKKADLLIEKGRELKDDRIVAQGMMLKATGLSRLGKRTEGLKLFAEGMKLLVPSGAELTKMIDDHPAFAVPDVVARPNPYLAEQHYGQGMHHYWSSEFQEAEKHFEQAISLFDRDARYQYFLGLARLMQKTKKKRADAYFALEKGAQLEAGNPRAFAEVNASLERIQGPLREYLEEFRRKGKLALK